MLLNLQNVHQREALVVPQSHHHVIAASAIDLYSMQLQKMTLNIQNLE